MRSSTLPGTLSSQSESSRMLETDLLLAVFLLVSSTFVNVATNHSIMKNNHILLLLS